MVHNLGAKELENLFESCKTYGTFASVKLVIVSACYSEDVAKLLHEAGFPAVVAILSITPVVENAVKVFNDYFLKQLLEGYPLEKSFENAKGLLSSKGSTFNPSYCCCNHKHDKDC